MATFAGPTHTVLHVTNGDCAAHGLRQSSVVTDADDVLPWRDVLHDGPVTGSGDADDFRHTRSAFIASRGWASVPEVTGDFARRDACLLHHVQRMMHLASASASASATASSPVEPQPEIVLWFEPDLYDQLQLVQVLCHIAESAGNALSDIISHLFVVPSHDMLGTLDASGFAPLFATRRLLTTGDFARARTIWQAFTSTSAGNMHDALRMYEPLPYVSTAMRRMCEEYPSVYNGLSRTEHQICAALANGALPMQALLPRAHHDFETWPWLGDSSFAWYVERLSNVASPLVTFEDGTPVLAPVSQSAPELTTAPESATAPVDTFWSRRVLLTATGLKVLAGESDAVRVNGIDRWIGGVHLTPSNDWRWNGAHLVQRR